MPDTRFPITLNARGALIKELHDSLLELGYAVPRNELAENVLGAGTMALIGEAQARFGLARTGTFDEQTHEALLRAVAAMRPQRSVEGRIVFDDGLPAAELTLRLYDKGFGAATRLAEGRTSAEGLYIIPYRPSDKLTSLELRAVASDGREVPISQVLWRAAAKETMNLIAPSTLRALGPEWDRMIVDLSRQTGQIPLGAAREDAERQDVGMLHAATGWDARLIGLAATAAAMSSSTGIPGEALYGMFRVGLPTDQKRLAAVSAANVGRAVRRAQSAGIISLSAQQLKQTETAFAELARTTRLATRAVGAVSSFGELLAASGLDTEAQRRFDNLVATHHGSGAELWEKAAATLPSESIQRLRTQGRLAYLTANNAPLMSALAPRLEGNLARLVDEGLYSSERWEERIRDLAPNEEALAKMIPSTYRGKLHERLASYAEDLSRKVRTSYPTRVVRTMIARDELRLGERHAGVKQGVVAFLEKGASLGFELGKTPIDVFVEEHRQALDASPVTVGEVKTLQRLYQITPDDEALQVLYDAGIRSAYDVNLFELREFLERFGPKLGESAARLVYQKSQQVSSVVYSFFTAAKQLESSPPVFALSPPAGELETAKQNLIRRFPTMRDLFGSIDFCECEHCRSVLSPAAYLVDLLRFLDPEATKWTHFLAAWKDAHGGVDYTSEYRKPYDALVERRPDLPHLPLTCENTHTALPYIDVVNEIFEYHVANGALEAEAARDTGDATSAELLAEPQHVVTEAYDTLKGARYPLALPFDLWTETARAFLEHFDTPFARVLELFRPADELLPPAVSPAPYYRADIFAEQLGLAPVEVAIFTDATPLTTWHELYGYPGGAAALAALPSAATLANRLGVSYKELVELVKARFVNPRLDSLALLGRLGLDVVDLFRFQGHASYPALSAEERAGIEARLDEVDDEFAPFDSRAWIAARWAANAFDDVLVLHDAGAGCNFERTVLRHVDGTDAEALDFHKLNLFVRLWRKLGWTIAEVDAALTAFIPSASRPLTAANLGAAMRTALVYLAHLDELHRRVTAQDGRLGLLSLWGELAPSLYAKRFLTRGILQNDAVFDHPLGQYLVAPGHDVKDHMVALEGALGLTAREIDAILVAGGDDPLTVDLSMPLVSRLYRHAVLARGLGLSIDDLLALSSLASLDPFAPLQAAPLDAIAQDQPFTSTLAFVELAGTVKDSGFTIAELRALLAHDLDPAGPYRPDTTALLALVKSLAAELQRIATEHAVPPAAGLTDEVMRKELALALPAEAADRFLAMLTGDVETEARVAAASALVSPALDDEPRVTLVYDAVRAEQRLIHRGVLTAAERTRLAGVESATVFSELLTRIHDANASFFEKYREGIAQAGDDEALFDPNATRATRYAAIAPALFALVRRKLSRHAVVQLLAAHLDADPVLTEAYVTDAGLIAMGATPLLDAFLGAASTGVTASTWTNATATGAPASVATTAGAATGGGATLSARFEGYLEVPAAGAYRFFARLDRQDATAELRIGDRPNAVLVGAAGTNDAEVSGFVELKPGVPYPFTFDVRQLGGGGAELLVQGEGLTKDGVRQLVLYPGSVVEGVRRARGLLASAMRLTAGLQLGEREARHLLVDGTVFAGLPLGELPVGPGAAPTTVARRLFARFVRVADYVRLRRAMGIRNDDLVAIMEHARREHPLGTDATAASAALLADLTTRLATVTRREEAVIRDVLAALEIAAGAAPDGGRLVARVPALGDEQGLWRVWHVLALVEKLGVPVAAAASWTALVSPATTAARAAELARELKHTVKARYSAEAWQRVARPIFDRLRRKQRDVLSAHIMRSLGFDRLEQLFEYFLLDPGMEPVVQTSRLQLAISSVQLFIQRCLLNLESTVHPSAINSRHWQWMKRYRLWEANRKIFLFPENWLEPELRDDKTFLYQALEGTLLQGDVDNDLAEDAFHAYLKTLETLARLEIVAMYTEENPFDPASNVLHVVGRTWSAPAKHYYRRLSASGWTGWEPVGVDIESDHLVPAIWRGRFHLFWVTFLEKVNEQANNGKTIRSTVEQNVEASAPKQIQLQLHWSELYQGEWQERRSSDLAPAVAVAPTFDRAGVFVHVTREANDGVEIHVGTPISRSFRLITKNGRPEVLTADAPPTVPYTTSGPRATRFIGSGPLKVSFTETITTEDGQPPVAVSATKPILQQGGSFSLLFPANELSGPTREIAALVNPFFYQDAEHSFYVEPTVEEVTIEKWEEWVITTPAPDPEIDPDWFERIPVIPEIPRHFPWPPRSDPTPWFERDPRSLHEMVYERDWVTNDATVLEFGDKLLGRTGAIDLVKVEAGGVASVPGTQVESLPGSQLEGNVVLVSPERGVVRTTEAPGAFAVVGSGGLNSVLLQQLGKLAPMGGL